jgi:hypothetical protein
VSATATCANCHQEADFRYEPVAGVTTDYCKKHLPSFLRKPGAQALLKDLEMERMILANIAAGVPAEASKPTRKKASETASEEKEAE